MNQKLLSDHLHPFANLEDYIKAIVVVNCFYSQKEPNFSIIYQCITQKVKIDIDKFELRKFVDRVTTSPNEYAFLFISNISDFKDSIDNYAMEINQPTISLGSPATNCIFCLNSGQYWFQYFIPKFNKITTLYLSGKIS